MSSGDLFAHSHRPDRDHLGIDSRGSVAPVASAVSVVSMKEKANRTRRATLLVLRRPGLPGGNNRRDVRAHRARIEAAFTYARLTEDKAS
ncbi:hypothetical protein GCM10010394_07420 [Streptomyces crystallinus]|uniref:Transposase n=1 Tax=Streptomyces crystallinus TaxID=68191 RepID=A0ABN1F3C9_9ACTN